jgi:phosphoglucomutase
MMNTFREDSPVQVAGQKVVAVEDFKTSTRKVESAMKKIQLPKSNVLKFILEDGSWFCHRPSGTEPKIKFYFGVKGSSLKESAEKLESLKQGVLKLIK